MSYLESVLGKANVQALTEYLLYGGKEKNFTASTYDERLRNMNKDFISIIQNYDTAGEESELYVKMNNLLLEYEHIYMEMGIQSGFLLMKDSQKEISHDCMQNFDNKQKMSMRLNLQSIGYYIKEGSRLLQVDETSFSERDQNAQVELETGLQYQLSEETIKTLLPLITNYTSKKEEIQFSLGMKAGAKLALLLTTDFEYDF